MESDVMVGLVDTGAVRQGGELHPWFAGRVIADEYGDSDPLDVDLDGVLDPGDAHGTFVAGRILAEAPGARVRSLRVLDTELGDDAAVADAIRLLLRWGVRLINLSFSGGPEEDAPPRSLELVLQEAHDAGAVVVCAAGNYGDARPHWPGAFDFALTVGAVDETAPRTRVEPPPIADFSDRGPWVDAYAGGVGVTGPFCWFTESASGAAAYDLAAQDFRGWASWNGTSFAAATVTGRIARAMHDTSVEPAVTRTAFEAKQYVLSQAKAEIVDAWSPDGPLPWVRSVFTPPSVPRHDE